MCDEADSDSQVGFRISRLVRRARLGPFRTRGCTGGLWRLGSLLVRRDGELWVRA
jgi:hypothetical protein